MFGALSIVLILLAGADAASTVLKLRWHELDGFLSDIVVGTPGQNLTVQVTNFYTNFHLVEEKCVGCGNVSRPFSAVRSTSFKSAEGFPFSAETIDGSVDGPKGLDLISSPALGEQRFGVAEHGYFAKLDRGRPREAAGVLGLGVYRDSLNHATPHGVYKAVGSVNVTFRVDSDGNAGELLLGAQKNDRCDENVDLHQESSCKVRGGYGPGFGDCIAFDKIVVGGQELRFNVSKGRGFFSLNQEKWGIDNVDEFSRLFGVSDGRVACQGPFPAVDVVLGGLVYTVPGKDFVKQNGAECILNVERSGYLQVGKSFFQHFCVSYDQSRRVVGIARAR